MDEEGMERPTSMVTDADVAIVDDLRELAAVEQHLESVRSRLDRLDTLLEEPRRPWWRR